MNRAIAASLMLVMLVGCAARTGALTPTVPQDVNRTWEVIAIVVVGYEILTAVDGRFGDTMSERIWDLLDRWPWLKYPMAVLFVALYGHFVWDWWR